MRLGVSFLHPDIGADPLAVRDFAQAADEAGFDFLSAVEHVAGAHPDRFVGVHTGFLNPPYLHTNLLHEPFTLFAYLSALTTRIELATAVLVLPQRETVLVAKQAAEVSLLSGGRLRLGVGVGWNYAEYEALGADFHSRGQREEEQIAVLRKLWSESLVTFEGRWHHLDRVAISPLPGVPIPIWIGGGAGEATLRRIARLADGWIPLFRPDDDTAEVISRMWRYVDEQGRDRSSVGLQCSIGPSNDPSEWVALASRWEKLGATHLGLTFASRGSGLSAMAQLERAVEIKRVLALELGY